MKFRAEPRRQFPVVDRSLRVVKKPAQPRDVLVPGLAVVGVLDEGERHPVARQRMDAMVVLAADGSASCRRLRDLKANDKVVVGMRGIRVVPESKERDRSAFAFMSNGVSSERQVETAIRQTAALMRHCREQGQKIIVVGGPVIVHTGGVKALSKLIQRGWVQALLAGNALGVHDIEASLLGTSLGVRQSDGRLEEHGHRNHMRAINSIYHAGGIKGAVESGKLTSGVMYECVKAGVPFVLAGSLRGGARRRKASRSARVTS